LRQVDSIDDSTWNDIASALRIYSWRCDADDQCDERENADLK